MSFNFSSSLTRKVSQVSLTDFNDSLICCRASKNKTHVIFFIAGKTVLGGEIVEIVEINDFYEKKIVENC